VSGILIFKNVFSGRPSRITLGMSCFINSAAGLKLLLVLDASDTAIAGMPRMVASNAAATVPEYEMRHQFVYGNVYAV